MITLGLALEAQLDLRDESPGGGSNNGSDFSELMAGDGDRYDFRLGRVVPTPKTPTKARRVIVCILHEKQRVLQRPFMIGTGHISDRGSHFWVSAQCPRHVSAI